MLFLSCTKPDPKNPFDPQVSPDSWAPSNLQYEVLDINSIQLYWTDNSNGEEGFTIERKVKLLKSLINYGVELPNPDSCVMFLNTSDWASGTKDLAVQLK